MNFFKTAPLSHMAAVQQCARKFQGEATVNLADMVLQVRGRNRQYSFYPQFVAVADGRLRYTTHTDDQTIGLKGWTPYAIKRWPTGMSKLAFKDFCQRNGLRTPAMWRAPSPEMRDFLVKKDASSFGEGLRGPFRRHEAQDPAQSLAEGGFYEAFVRGRIVKATYWDGRLACVEILDMPTVKGDGRSSVRELFASRCIDPPPEHEWLFLGGVAAYQGLTLDTIPAAGHPVLIDYRNGSYAHPRSRRNANALQEIAGSALLAQLAGCGPVLWQGIPETLRPATLFAVDAILDEQERLWLLEMNCNPVCHPDVYGPMMETLFGAADATEAPPQLPPSALPDADAVTQLPQSSSGGTPPFAASSRRFRVC